MNKIIRNILIGGQLLLTNLAMAAYHTLGNDSACDYQASEISIQELIDAGKTRLLISNNVIFYESISINKNVTLIGGYNNCSAADNNIISETKTIINGSQLGPVFKITHPNNGSTLHIYLRGFNITNGAKQGQHQGGGLSVYSPNSSVAVTIEDSLISNNKGNRGAGVHLNGNNVQIYLANTIILNNEVVGTTAGSALGGGAFCLGGKLTLGRNTGVYGNEAYSNVMNAGYGGGIYATNGCEVALSPGATGDLFDLRGISYNTASAHGGGIYLSNGANITTQGFGTPINIDHNLSDSIHNGFGDGGGVFMTGVDTFMEVSGLKMTNNEAVKGGGAAILDQASMDIIFRNNCWNPQKCNQINDNTTATVDGYGGAFFLNQGSVSLEYAHLTQNKANAGSVVFAENNSSVIMTRSMIYENGADVSEPWSDETVYDLNASNIIMSHVTSAFNQAQAVTIRQINGEHHLSNSIFHEPMTNQIGNFIGGSGIKDCLMVDNNLGIGSANSNVLIDNPLLTDDFHLSEGSPAIDRCFEIINNSDNQELDIDGDMAPYDDPMINNGPGFLDIGADEFKLSDVIFKNSFEPFL